MTDLIRALRPGHEGADPVDILKRLLGPDYDVEYGKADIADVIRIRFNGANRLRRRFWSDIIIKMCHKGIVVSPIGCTSKVFPATVGRLARIADWIKADGRNVNEDRRTLRPSHIKTDKPHPQPGKRTSMVGHIEHVRYSLDPIGPIDIFYIRDLDFHDSGLQSLRVENRENVIGYIRLVVWEQEAEADVDFIWVHPSYRRTGIATKLIEKAKQYHQKIKTPTLTNAGSKFFGAMNLTESLFETSSGGKFDVYAVRVTTQDEADQPDPKLFGGCWRFCTHADLVDAVQSNIAYVEPRGLEAYAIVVGGVLAEWELTLEDITVNNGEMRYRAKDLFDADYSPGATIVYKGPARSFHGLSESKKGWIGVDLDGTLATYTKWRGPHVIGKPIPRMVGKVKRALASGKTVKIFTARIARKSKGVEKKIKEWCKEHLGHELEVTNAKDEFCEEIWDDRARRVHKNRGTFAENFRKVIEAVISAS